jgi:hypothetical protein
MLKVKKATFTVGLINQLMATDLQPISTPMALLQSIVMEEYNGQIKTNNPTKTANLPKNPEIRGYAEELAELE